MAAKETEKGEAGLKPKVDGQKRRLCGRQPNSSFILFERSNVCSHTTQREILRGNCWDLWIFTNGGFMHWESGQWGGPGWHATTSLLFPVPTVAPGNLLFQHHEHIFVDFITICLWDNTAQVLLCDSSFVQPPTLGVPPGPCSTTCGHGCVAVSCVDLPWVCFILLHFN